MHDMTCICARIITYTAPLMRKIKNSNGEDNGNQITGFPCIPGMLYQL